mgnify:FL=1
MNMESKMIDESRIYTENGEVKVRHIINESTDIDMTPHPTESRVFVKNGEVVTILSEEIENKGYLSLEESKRLIISEVEAIYRQNELL